MTDAKTTPAKTSAKVATDQAAAAKPSSAKTNNAAPATDFAPSGAPNQVVEGVDPSHPAVDNDPRAGTTGDQNRIDFNDPSLSESEAVQQNLQDQADA